MHAPSRSYRLASISPNLASTSPAPRHLAAEAAWTPRRIWPNTWAWCSFPLGPLRRLQALQVGTMIFAWGKQRSNVHARRLNQAACIQPACNPPRLVAGRWLGQRHLHQLTLLLMFTAPSQLLPTAAAFFNASVPFHFHLLSTPLPLFESARSAHTPLQPSNRQWFTHMFLPQTRPPPPAPPATLHQTPIPRLRLPPLGPRPCWRLLRLRLRRPSVH